MEPNSVLPVLLTAVVVVMVASVGAGIALWWSPQSRIRQIIRRAWFVVAVLATLAVVIFWISTMFGASDRSGVNRSLQQRQQDELHQRLQKGGH
jgi:ABC-type sugar transport system permease subunit